MPSAVAMAVRYSSLPAFMPQEYPILAAGVAAKSLIRKLQ